MNLHVVIGKIDQHSKRLKYKNNPCNSQSQVTPKQKFEGYVTSASCIRLLKYFSPNFIAPEFPTAVGAGYLTTPSS